VAISSSLSISFSMSWTLRVAQRAAKSLKRAPAEDRTRIVAALGEMRQAPFAGDIVRLRGEANTWRRRVGNYRIFFEVSAQGRTVDILDIAQRTSTTY
jgi:mRNA-degrading endonuclease RelE of RelBE toxin-antitoxin system